MDSMPGFQKSKEFLDRLCENSQAAQNSDDSDDGSYVNPYSKLDLNPSNSKPPENLNGKVKEVKYVNPYASLDLEPKS